MHCICICQLQSILWLNIKKYFLSQKKDGVNTPGYISTSTEPLEVALCVVLLVSVLVCAFIGGHVIYKRKEIFLTPFSFTGHKLRDIFLIVVHTPYFRLWVSERLFKVKWANFQLYHGQNKLLFNEMMVITALQYSNTLS